MDDSRPSIPAQRLSAALWVILLVGVGVLMTMIAAGSAWVGRARREEYVAGRSVGEWVDEVKRFVASGQNDPELVNALARPQAEPVLLACLREKDIRVRRWGASMLRFNKPSPASLQAFLVLVGESDNTLREQALLGLAKARAAAGPATARVTAMATDPDEEFRDLARYALWQIAPAAAMKVEQWRDVPSDELGFRAKLPGEPEHTSSAEGRTEDVLLGDHFFATEGFCSYQVGVSPVAPEVSSRVVDWQAWMRELAEHTADRLKGELASFEMIEHKGRVGYEWIVTLTDPNSGLDFESRTRAFIVGDEQYLAVACYPVEDFLRSASTDFFFDSVEIVKEQSEASAGNE